MALELETIADVYARDGFVFPINAVSEYEAKSIRADLETAEAELADDPIKLALVRSYPNHLIPSFDKLVRNQNLINAVIPILGPDLLVWSGGLFIKEANTPHIVTWHQDLNYWGLNEIDEVTAWVALGTADLDSGCMRFVPGSHTKSLVPHNDTFAEDNLLSRGQEIAVEVDDSDGVDVILKTGQASLHHGHLFHASGPNRTSDRRIGVAIRYIKPSMKQRNGAKSLVTLVAGEDNFNNFKSVGPPSGWLADRDFDLCAADSDSKREILYEGAETDQGQRYRKV
ncbi:MAG: phytanoyl-CoA dioxygenase [Rhodospirillaceae bacterium]|nr:phytanoyl-CoA dioxygenase [Rhodospirillaceae bacterium]|tara:strand:+ start:5202 stop:6053 length:852 start_codon:yes stop_codon:yes gene_type:complete